MDDIFISPPSFYLFAERKYLNEKLHALANYQRAVKFHASVPDFNHAELSSAL
jgi:hypothetical protein